jgi:hypothetical protein
MTQIICAIALAVTPSAPGCQRGGHAVHEAWMERGGHAVVVLAPLPHLRVWECIHPKEGAWNDTGDPYWGGLQMDRSFMAAYGADFEREHAGEGWGGLGFADAWTPREQMEAAERAYRARGLTPWPLTRIGCG